MSNLTAYCPRCGVQMGAVRRVVRTVDEAFLPPAKGHFVRDREMFIDDEVTYRLVCPTFACGSTHERVSVEIMDDLDMKSTDDGLLGPT